MLLRDSRATDALRPLNFEPDVNRYAEGSCMITLGYTRVLCTATVEERVPPFLRNQGRGWVTAEYAMLPRATHTRSDREASRGRLSGRTQEIQRLIGRSLRAVVDDKLLGERQIRIDCDVLQADGGTRTASISGAYVALHRALSRLLRAGAVSALPLHSAVAAVSCGIVGGKLCLDLDYGEDSQAEVDANFVGSPLGLIEVQASAEAKPFPRARMGELLELAQVGLQEILEAQKQVLEGGS